MVCKCSFEEAVSFSLESYGCKHIKVAKQSGFVTSWFFSLDFKNYLWDFELISTTNDLSTLPSLRWIRPHKVWGWPHINSAGIICFEDGQGIEFEPKDIAGVITWVLDEGTNLLKKYWNMGKAKRKREFFDELDGYLKSMGVPEVLQIDNYGNKDVDIAYAEVEYPKIGKERGVVRRVFRSSLSYVPSRNSCEKLVVMTISYKKIPPITGQVNESWWTKIYDQLSQEQLLLLEGKRCRGIIFRVQNSYGYCEFLIHWGQGKYNNKRWLGRLYRIQFASWEYVTQRTGIPASRQRIAVVGVGAVGSRIAEMALLSGASDIYLVDDDKFSADNMGRHLLGLNSVGKYKVDELSIHFKSRIPGVNIHPFRVRAQKYFSQDNNDYDIIFLATGNSSLEKGIILRAFKEKWNSVLVSVSVEAYGVGGQIIIMHTNIKGCLYCLYIDNETNTLMPNLQGGFIEPGQKISKQLTGCGAFTPFSALNASKTAMLAYEYAVSKKYGYLRWAGNNDIAMSEGIILTPAYFNIFNENTPSFLHSEQIAKKGCPCCG